MSQRKFFTEQNPHTQNSEKTKEKISDSANSGNSLSKCTMEQRPRGMGLCLKYPNRNTKSEIEHPCLSEECLVEWHMINHVDVIVH